MLFAEGHPWEEAMPRQSAGIRVRVLFAPAWLNLRAVVHTWRSLTPWVMCEDGASMPHQPITAKARLRPERRVCVHVE